MNMEDRIEEAAKEYSADRFFENDGNISNVREISFEAGANWALQNQWNDAKDKLPEQDEHVLLYAEGLYLHCRYRDDKFIIIDGFPCGETPKGEIIYSSEIFNPNVVEDYWMPIPSLPTCSKNE